MILTRWLFKMIGDVFLLGVVNRSFGLALALLALLVLGLTTAAAQVSAPFIYTLF